MPGHRTGEVGGHSTGHDIKSSNGSGASNMSDFMYQDSEDLEITASGSSALGGSKPPSHGSGGGNDGGGPWSPKRPGSPASLSSNSLQGWAASNEDNEEYFWGENFTEGLGSDAGDGGDGGFGLDPSAFVFNQHHSGQLLTPAEFICRSQLNSSSTPRIPQGQGSLPPSSPPPKMSHTASSSSVVLSMPVELDASMDAPL